MTTYTWKIESASAGSMLVEFERDEVKTMLNVPVPPSGADLGEWVDKFAPRSQWVVAPLTITVGATGQGNVELPTPEPVAPPEAPQVGGSINEEHLRALIFQVLEEIQASNV